MLFNLSCQLSICPPLGDLFLLQELSDVPAAFTEVDSRGWFPLHKAAVQSSPQVLELVLHGECYELEV